MIIYLYDGRVPGKSKFQFLWQMQEPTEDKARKETSILVEHNNCVFATLTGHTIHVYKSLIIAIIINLITEHNIM